MKPVRGEQLARYRLSLVRERLDGVGVPWAVFAGAAAYCYGSTREITDIDILVRCEDLEKAQTAISDADTRGIDVGCGSEIETEQGTCRFYFDDEMMGRVQQRYLFGVKVPIISVEDNIIFKAILQRGKDEGKHDLIDVWCMIEHENIDEEYLKDRIQRCQAEERVKPILLSKIPDLLKSKHE